MRQVIVRQLGDPGAQGTLEVVEDELPLPVQVGPGVVRVRVLVASLNYADTLQIRGQYQEKREPPFVPGAEMCGVVAAVGPGRSPFRVGQRVCGLSPNGAMSELVDVPVGSVFPVPDGVPIEEAACACVAVGTAWMSLVQRARVHSGSRVLVLGGSGGVGSAAVQICAALGAEVVATATSARKADFVRELGAKAVIGIGRSDRAEALSSKLRAALGRGTADVVLDNVGGPLFDAAMGALKWGGQVCVVGFAGGSIPRIPANRLLVKNVTVHGIYWGGHLIRGHPEPVRESVSAAMALIGSRRLRVPVGAAYDLQDAAEALRALERGAVLGKVVVRVAAPPRASL